MVSLSKPDSSSPRLEPASTLANAAHLDFTRPPESRTSLSKRDKPDLNVTRMAFERLALSENSQDAGKTPKEMYAESIEHAKSSVKALQDFIDAFRDLRLSNEDDLTQSFNSGDTNINQKFQDHVTFVRQYKEQLLAKNNVLGEAIQTMQQHKNTYEHIQKEYLPEEKRAIEQQYAELQNARRKLGSHSTYMDGLDRLIDRVENYAALVKQYTDIARKNQEVADRLGALPDPLCVTSDNEEGLKNYREKYDQTYPAIKVQAQKLEAFRQAIRNTDTQQSTSFTSLILPKHANQLADTFQAYRESRRDVNEMLRVYSEKTRRGTVDGYLGSHQIEEKKAHRHHTELFSKLGDASCGHMAILIMEEIFGADLSHSRALKRIMQHFSKRSRTSDGFDTHQIRDTLSDSPNHELSFNSFFLWMYTKREREDIMDHAPDRIAPLEQLGTFIHQHITLQSGEEIYAPVVCGVAREHVEDEHWVVLQAIDETNRVRYYSQDLVVTTQLADVVELVKNAGRFISIIAVNHGYAAHQSGEDIFPNAGD